MKHLKLILAALAMVFIANEMAMAQTPNTALVFVRSGSLDGTFDMSDSSNLDGTQGSGSEDMPYNREVTGLAVSIPFINAPTMNTTFNRSGNVWTNGSTSGSIEYRITCTGCRMNNNITITGMVSVSSGVTFHIIQITNLTDANILSSASAGTFVFESTALSSIAATDRTFYFELNPPMSNQVSHQASSVHPFVLDGTNGAGTMASPYNGNITSVAIITVFTDQGEPNFNTNFTRTGNVWTNTGDIIYTFTCNVCRETDDIEIEAVRAVTRTVIGTITTQTVTFQNITAENRIAGTGMGTIVVDSPSNIYPTSSQTNLASRTIYFTQNNTPPQLQMLEGTLGASPNERTGTWTATFTQPVDGVMAGNFMVSGERAAETTATNPVATMPDANGLAMVWTFTSTTTGEMGGTVIYTFQAMPTINNGADIALTEVATDGSQMATITIGAIDTPDETPTPETETPEPETESPTTPQEQPSIPTEQITQFMQNQATQYVSKIPTLTNRLNIEQENESQLNATNGNLNFNGNGEHTWIEGSYIKGDSNNQTIESTYIIFGVDYYQTKNLVVGMLAQFDEGEYNFRGNQFNTSGFTTSGWLMGGYVLGNANYDLQMESKLAYGESKVEVGEMEIETERLLFSATVQRDLQTRKNYIFTPSVQYTYFTEEASMAEIELNSLELSFGASNEIIWNESKLTPSISLAGSFDSTNADDNSKATIEGSFNYAGTSGISMHIGGYYDIISDKTYIKTYGVATGISIKF